MSHERGKLDIELLQSLADTGEIDTVIVGFTDHYGRVQGKRVDASFFVEEVAAAGTHGCNYLLTVDMDMEPISGYRFANWELGYGDFHMVPDMKTLRLASWLSSTAIVLCDLLDDTTEDFVSVAPRSILRRQIDRLDELGFSAKAASELEYYLYEESYREAADIGRLVQRGLSPHAGGARGVLQRGCSPAPISVRHSSRKFQG